MSKRYFIDLKQLDPNNGEEEHEENGNDDDIVDGLDGHDQTLHNLLQALGPRKYKNSNISVSPYFCVFVRHSSMQGFKSTVVARLLSV